MTDLTGKKIAILVEDYFEEAELTGPLLALQETGASVDIIAPEAGDIHSMKHAERGDTFQADRSIDDVRLDDYDALVLPGGAVNADSLRMNIKARLWVKQFLRMGKPVAAICHAPWLLASAGLVKNRRLTSYFSIQDDLRNAGAEWIDQAVVIDHNLITSRDPDDISAFDEAIITMLGQPSHQELVLV